MVVTASGKQGQIRTLDYDGEMWVNVEDTLMLFEASRDRFIIEGNGVCADMMGKLCATLRGVLGG